MYSFEFITVIRLIKIFCYFLRCEIPQCDTKDSSYNPDWLQSAVPFKDDLKEPQKCLRYRYSMLQNNNDTDAVVAGTCSPKAFDINFKEKCDKWVFGETETTIVNDVSRIQFSHGFKFKNITKHFSSASCARKTNGNYLWWVRSTVLASSSAFL